MAAIGSMCARRILQTRKGTLCPLNISSYRFLCQNSLCLRPTSPFHRIFRAVHRHGWLNDEIKICFISAPFICHHHARPSPRLATQGRQFATDPSQPVKEPGLNITEDILKAKVGGRSEQKEDNKGGASGEDEKKKDSWFSGKHAWKLGLLSMAGMGILMSGNLLLLWGAPMHDKDGNELKDEFSELPSWKAYPKRAWKEFHFFKKMIQEPSSAKLLPDPVKEPYYQPPYTLVLEMTNVLVHPDWTLGTGWRFKKRPGVDYFLQQVAPPLFEIVIYTREQGFTAFPIIDGLDPNGYISFRLFRDATRYMDGHHVKDLGCLNRDLSKVIIVDCDPKSYQLHPRNALGLKKWTGDDDRALLDLGAFLRTIAMSGVDDIRVVLDYYHQFDDPISVFKENQRKLQEEQERMVAENVDKSKQSSLAGKWSVGLFGRRKGT